MSQNKNYHDYRQRLIGRIEQLVTPNLKKILILGDRFEGLENNWKNSGKKITRLETLKADWFDVTRDKPEFDLPIEKPSFDLVIAYHSLEKALDPERLVLELGKYLVKEGLFIYIVYNVGHISTVVNLITEGWTPKHDGALREGHIRYFSYDSLKELLKLTGFDIVSEDIYGLPEFNKLTNELVKCTKNPYLNALSFIILGKRVETFPFIEGTYP